MANKKSAQKAQRQSERRAARNKTIRSAVRTYLKKATAAVAEGAENASEVVRQAVSQLDRAAQKGVIHDNNAARHKSQLMRHLHSILNPGQAAPAAEEPAAVAPAPATKTRTPRATAPRGAKAAAGTAKTPTKPKTATATRPRATTTRKKAGE